MMMKKKAFCLEIDSHSLSIVPQKCGVYLFKDVSGKVLYVGKASRLRSRIRSHLKGTSPTPRQKFLRQRFKQVDLFITENEKEAFILEDIMIKRHRPPYNVRLRDDKTYPYIRLSMQEDFPKLSIVRRRKEDGARYLGPYPSASKMKATLSLIQDIFQIATCKIKITGQEKRPCLEYQIHRCSAPCTGYISKEDYRTQVKQALSLLEGKQQSLLNLLRQKMEQASQNLHFEKAAVYRDRLRAIESVVERQRVVSSSQLACDVAGWAVEKKKGVLSLLNIREGKIIGKENYLFLLPEESQEFIGKALLAVYLRKEGLPFQLLLPFHFLDEKELRLFARARKQQMRMSVPQRGSKKELVKLAEENATVFLQMSQKREEWEATRQQKRVVALQQLFDLPHLPSHIECIDIAHFQGEAQVGSLVCFLDGKANKRNYRRYIIRTADSLNDPAAIREVVKRRVARKKGRHILPDLLLLDGGIAQLRQAEQALKEAAIEIPLFALAKQAETLITHSGKRIQLSPHHPALQLLQQLRDEAHRFAVQFHRERFRKRIKQSVFSKMKGVSEQKKRAIWRVYLDSFTTWDVDGDKLLQELGIHETVRKEVMKNLTVRRDD